MGCICAALCGPKQDKGKRFSGIIFNDSEHEVEYCICTTRRKTIKHTITNNQGTNFRLDVNAGNILSPTNTNAIGGQVGATDNVQDFREMQDVDTLGQIWVKPHHYSTQGLLDLVYQQENPIFLSISYFEKNIRNNLQVNVQVTNRDNICFIVTKDLACEPLSQLQQESFKRKFDKNLDSDKAYSKEKKEVNQKQRLKNQIEEWLHNKLYNNQVVSKLAPTQTD